jgi:NADPH:quinone reductase-like Zn-dependent oxidoreductase
MKNSAITVASAALATAGAIRPVIDRRYEFSQMREAHAYVETGRKRGSVVVRVNQDAAS